MNLYERISNGLMESTRSDLLDNYFSRLSDFLSKYDVSFTTTPKSIKFSLNDNPDKLIAYVDFSTISPYSKVKTPISSIQKYFKEDGNWFIYHYLRDKYGWQNIYVKGETLTPEYSKIKKDMLKDISTFVSNCKDLEKAEITGAKDRIEAKEQKTDKMLGEHPISIVFTPRDWQGSLNINQVKQYLSGLKYTCEKVGSSYYITFNRNDLDAVKDRYNVLKDLADVTLRESDNLSEDERLLNEQDDTLKQLIKDEFGFDIKYLDYNSTEFAKHGNLNEFIRKCLEEAKDIGLEVDEIVFGYPGSGDNYVGNHDSRISITDDVMKENGTILRKGLPSDERGLDMISRSVLSKPISIDEMGNIFTDGKEYSIQGIVDEFAYLYYLGTDRESALRLMQAIR